MKPKNLIDLKIDEKTYRELVSAACAWDAIREEIAQCEGEPAKRRPRFLLPKIEKSRHSLDRHFLDDKDLKDHVMHMKGALDTVMRYAHEMMWDELAWHLAEEEYERQSITTGIDPKTAEKKIAEMAHGLEKEFEENGLQNVRIVKM